MSEETIFAAALAISNPLNRSKYLDEACDGNATLRRDIEALLTALGADIEEREGSRIAIILFNQVQVFHRSHPSPTTDKGAVASVRRWLEANDITPESVKEPSDEEQPDAH